MTHRVDLDWTKNGQNHTFHIDYDTEIIAERVAALLTTDVVRDGVTVRHFELGDGDTSIATAQKAQRMTAIHWIIDKVTDGLAWATRGKEIIDPECLAVLVDGANNLRSQLMILGCTRDEVIGALGKMLEQLAGEVPPGFFTPAQPERAGE